MTDNEDDDLVAGAGALREPRERRLDARLRRDARNTRILRSLLGEVHDIRIRHAVALVRGVDEGECPPPELFAVLRLSTKSRDDEQMRLRLERPGNGEQHSRQKRRSHTKPLFFRYAHSPVTRLTRSRKTIGMSHRSI